MERRQLPAAAPALIRRPPDALPRPWTSQSGGARLLGCQVAHDHGEPVESARYEGDLDLRQTRSIRATAGGRRVAAPSRRLPDTAAATNPFAKLVEQGRWCCLPSRCFSESQGRCVAPGAPIADVPRLVEEERIIWMASDAGQDGSSDSSPARRSTSGRFEWSPTIPGPPQIPNRLRHMQDDEPAVTAEARNAVQNGDCA